MVMVHSYFSLNSLMKQRILLTLYLYIDTLLAVEAMSHVHIEIIGVGGWMHGGRLPWSHGW